MDDTTQVNQDIHGIDENNSNTGENQNKAGEYTERERQLYARMKKEQADKDALVAEIAQLKGNTNSQPSNVPDSEWRERVELGAIHGIKDEDTLNFIMKNGGIKALQDEFVQSAIQKKREDNENKEKIAFNTSSKSSIDRRYSPQELQSMTASEMEAVLSGKKR